MWLDVPLMNRLGVELPVDDDVCFLEPLFYVSHGELEAVRHVAGVLRVGCSPTAGTQRRVGQGQQPLMQDGSAILHGVVGVKGRFQHLVVDVDQ